MARPGPRYCNSPSTGCCVEDITLAAIPFANHTFNFYAAATIGDQACLTITQNYLAHRILA